MFKVLIAVLACLAVLLCQTEAKANPPQTVTVVRTVQVQQPILLQQQTVQTTTYQTQALVAPACQGQLGASYGTGYINGGLNVGIGINRGFRRNEVFIGNGRGGVVGVRR